MRVPIQQVAVLGATGQVGFPLCRALLELGHQVKAFSRRRSDFNAQQLADLEEDGAVIVLQNDLRDISRLAGNLSGCDTVVVALRMSVQILVSYGPAILEASRLAGVSRFVPDEFGVHTLGLDYGVGALLDAKKRFQKQLFSTGLDWTLIYNGTIFDYFLPNLRMFEKITTFGDLDMPIATHHIDDIAKIAALAVTDPRTLNHAVQLQANLVTQRYALETLRSCWPGVHFNYAHVTQEQILTELANANPENFTAKAGAENDLERWGINNAIFVHGKLCNLEDPQTLSAVALYPDQNFIPPEEMLADEEFVFGDDNVA